MLGHTALRHNKIINNSQKGKDKTKNSSRLWISKSSRMLFHTHSEFRGAGTKCPKTKTTKGQDLKIKDLLAKDLLAKDLLAKDLKYI